MKITICFGGSILVPEEIETGIIKKIVRSLSELKEEDHEILVVTGGGSTAKKYISAAEKFDISHKDMDKIGISATRLNAQLLIAALGEIAEPEVPKNFEKAIRSSLKGNMPVMGGTQPGHTTDAVAAELADTSNSDLLIFFTDVDGVFTADPKKNPDAEKINKMTNSELFDLMSKMEFEPGMTAIIDPLATKILKNSKIRVLVLSKNEILRLSRILKGSSPRGTEITPSEK